MVMPHYRFVCDVDSTKAWFSFTQNIAHNVIAVLTKTQSSLQIQIKKPCYPGKDDGGYSPIWPI